MNAERWQQILMDRLYGELSEEQAQEFDAHLRENPEARREWEDFSSLRERLAASAEQVPSLPLLRRAAPQRRWGMFAAGFAAAAGIFCAGFLIGQRPTAESGGATAALDARQIESGLAQLGLDAAEIRRSIAAQRDLESRTDVLAARLEGGSPAETAAGSEFQLTQAEFEAGLTRIMNRIDYERQRDLEFVLNEITAVDQRQSTRIDTNRQALQYALQAVSNPPAQ